VYRARNKYTGELFAIKVTDKKKVKRIGSSSKHPSSGNISDEVMEIMIQSQLDCPQIARLHYHFEDQQNVYMVLEFCEG
jgi:serine/threonine protein kinase